MIEEDAKTKMNEELQNFARQQLKTKLAKCTEAEQMVFKYMYSPNNITTDIIAVVDNMSVDKLDWAMQQVSRTLEKKICTQQTK